MNQTTTPARNVDFNKLKQYLKATVGRELNNNPPPKGKEKEHVANLIDRVYQSTNIQLSRTLKEQLFMEILNEIIGYGHLQPLIDDNSISEIMVNGPNQVFIEKDGKLQQVKIHFDGEEELRRIIDKIIEPLGRHIDESRPMVDARLPDGSRVNAVIPPCAIDGSSITIRKFSKEKLGVQDLINFGSMTDTMATFLNACVASRLNVVISGGTGSGKTTTLNILSSFIPNDERIVTIEDAAELQLRQDHVVRLETKPPDLDGLNEVTIRALVRNALRMRPERIIIGECRGGEAIDMLQAMNTGHDGSMTTVHANNPRDAISRLETLCLMSGMDLPLFVIRRQIASAVDLIVQQSRLRDGSRKITSITEIAGMEGDTVVLSEIFRFNQTGIGENGKVIGEMGATGIRPQFTEALDAAGFKLGPEVYGATAANILSRNRR
ncbi:MAG: CpaF family protein [Anaerolineaceae bacterium]|nr:CpaF family protein [Anaerolineaceae bacterium]